MRIMMNQELCLIEEFLNSPRAPEKAFSLLALDGFLTAIAVGPEKIPVADWLPIILGRAPPASSDTVEAEKVEHAILARYTEIHYQLRSAVALYQPAYLQIAAPGEPLWIVRVAEWAQGFWEGT